MNDDHISTGQFDRAYQRLLVYQARELYNYLHREREWYAEIGPMQPEREAKWQRFCDLQDKAYRRYHRRLHLAYGPERE